MSDCRDFALLLDDFIDEALKPDDRRMVEEHLAACDTCRAEFDAVRAVVRAAAELPETSVEPRDLWPGIAERLEAAPRTRRRWQPWLAAAAMLVAVSGAWWAGRWSAAPSPHSVAPSTDAVRATAESSADFRQEYRRARDELDALLAARREGMSPENLIIVEESLCVIDRAIEDIESALLDNPEDPNLNRSLRLAYDRQLHVLETATRWTLQS
jgi:anti-sigma factor RsiW